MIRLWTPTLLLLCAALIALPAVAEESAEDIVRTSQSKGYRGNSIMQLVLTETTKSGAKPPKKMTMSTRVVDEQVQSHAMFMEPESMRGMQLLSLDQADGPVLRWIYMPAGNSLNTIDDSQRTQSFLGTDFTHEDLELGDPDGGSHTLVGSETITIGGQSLDCHKIESTPNEGLATRYGRIVTWIEKGSYAPRRVLLFAVEDPTTEYKRLTFEAVAVENGAVIPTNMLMENLAKGTSTRIEVTEYRLDVPAEDLSDALFDHEQLGANVPQ